MGHKRREKSIRTNGSILEMSGITKLSIIHAVDNRKEARRRHAGISHATEVVNHIFTIAKSV